VEYEEMVTMWRRQEYRSPSIEEDKKINRIPVSSSNISSIGYDQDSQILEEEFLKGNIYQYFDVPQAVYEEFLSADSKGKYLIAQIKGNYRYVRV
jgi:KTSC domain